MGKSDGITRSRSKVGETYKGFSIIRVLAIHHWFNQWNRRYEMTKQYETKREVYYEFCKEGDENRPAQAYGGVYPTPKSIETAKEAIDKMLSGEVIYFTDAEREKYVYRPNHKCQWGYGYESLMKILKEHKKADKRMKLLLEDRLDDANFHYEAGELSQEHYDELEKYITDHYTFHEKFEIYTYTKSKRIKDPKQFEAGLKEAVEAYFASQGVKDTTAEIKFVENW